MDLKITENITANVSLKDIEALIKESARKDGYDVMQVTPTYNSGYHDQRGGSSPRQFSGLKVDLRRKHEPTPKPIGPPPRDWFDINDK